MINLELSKQLQDLENMIMGVSTNLLRPISRKYDSAEHTFPKELEVLNNASAPKSDKKGKKADDDGEGNGIINGGNLSSIITTGAMCWGDSGLTLAIPGRGLGNAAIAAVAQGEQRERFLGKYAAMAITEPSTGSDSANISTTAVEDGDDYILNGEKIFVTDGDRCEVVVAWVTLDKSKGKAAIKSIVVEKGTPGMDVVRLEDKMGLRASDTAAITFTDCRVPKKNLLGNPEVADTEEARKKAFGGVMQTFDNTRPVVAAMALGVAKAALDMTKELLEKEGVKPGYDKTLYNSTALEAELYRMEANLESARLLTLKAGWMADNKQPNSLEASTCKAKAGRVGNDITLKCVEICGSLGYGHEYLLEKFARDSKILDIFEGTQQIQQLIVARRVLGLSSQELK